MFEFKKFHMFKYKCVSISEKVNLNFYEIV